MPWPTNISLAQTETEQETVVPMTDEQREARITRQRENNASYHVSQLRLEYLSPKQQVCLFNKLVELLATK